MNKVTNFADLMNTNNFKSFKTMELRRRNVEIKTEDGIVNYEKRYFLCLTADKSDKVAYINVSKELHEKMLKQDEKSLGAFCNKFNVLITTHEGKEYYTMITPNIKSAIVRK